MIASYQTKIEGAMHSYFLSNNLFRLLIYDTNKATAAKPAAATKIYNLDCL